MEDVVAVFHPNVVPALVGFYRIVVPEVVRDRFLSIVCIHIGGELRGHGAVRPRVSVDGIGAEGIELAADPTEGGDLAVGRDGDTLDAAYHVIGA